MNSVTLSSLESAALAWLADCTFAFDPHAVRLPEGMLCIEYWHAANQTYGALIVTETLTADDVFKLITAMELRVAARQQHDFDQMVQNGYSRADAHAATLGYPTRAAICVPVDEIADDAYEAYQRASGTFDEPLIIAVWDGGQWSFEEEVIL